MLPHLWETSFVVAFKKWVTQWGPSCFTYNFFFSLCLLLSSIKLTWEYFSFCMCQWSHWRWFPPAPTGWTYPARAVKIKDKVTYWGKYVNVDQSALQCKLSLDPWVRIYCSNDVRSNELGSYLFDILTCHYLGHYLCHYLVNDWKLTQQHFT